VKLACQYLFRRRDHDCRWNHAGLGVLLVQRVPWIRCILVVLLSQRRQLRHFYQTLPSTLLHNHIHWFWSHLPWQKWFTETTVSLFLLLHRSNSAIEEICFRFFWCPYKFRNVDAILSLIPFLVRCTASRGLLLWGRNNHRFGIPDPDFPFIHLIRGSNDNYGPFTRQYVYSGSKKLHSNGSPCY